MSPSYTIAILLLLVPMLQITTVVDSATIRDYVNSAAHLVGLDSVVSEETAVPDTETETDSPSITADASAPGFLSATNGAGSSCCNIPQPPCVTVEKVEQKQHPVVVEPVVVPAPVPVPVLVPEPVLPCPPRPPCAQECPIDLDSARAKSHSRMWEVAMKGKALASTLTHALAAPVVFTNSKISSAASYLPGIMAAKGKIVGHMVSFPLQVLAEKSSLLAKGAAAVVVGPPVAIGTAAAAGVSGLMEAVNDIRRQQQECLCRSLLAKEVKEDKHEKKTEVTQVSCPCSTPGSVLVADGSRKEETFTIDDPITDSPVTESIGGSQSDARESVTDATFTTTSEASMDMISEE